MIKPWIEHERRTCKNGEKDPKVFKCPGNCGGRFYILWRDANGVKCRDHEGAWDTRREATKRIEVLQDQGRNNVLGLNKQITLLEGSQIFRKHVMPRLATDRQRYHCDIYWGQINEAMGNLLINKITYTHIVDYWESFLKRECKASTANRSIMWIGSMYERLRMWNAMVPEMMPEKVALPETNPVKVAKEYLGRRKSELPFKRHRVLSREELQKMKSVCMLKFPGFWEEIKLAMLTSLRKSDLLALGTNTKAVGIQGKTQRPFDLPVTIEHQVIERGLRTRWDSLRKILGWYEEGTPLHTTWHDLRHCGPTMIAEMGYSSKIIQSILGHSTEQQSMTYTNVRKHALAPAMEALQKELNSI